VVVVVKTCCCVLLAAGIVVRDKEEKVCIRVLGVKWKLNERESDKDLLLSDAHKSLMNV
jgi:hypothetical protein